MNDLSEKIIAQRTVVREVQADVKRLGEAYRTALKTNPIGASGKKAEYDAARKALDEERAALFGLTQEQANARLSVKNSVTNTACSKRKVVMLRTLSVT